MNSAAVKTMVDSQMALWPQQMAPTNQTSFWESASNESTEVQSAIQTKPYTSGARDAEIIPTIIRTAEKKQ